VQVLSIQKNWILHNLRTIPGNFGTKTVMNVTSWSSLIFFNILQWKCLRVANFCRDLGTLPKVFSESYFEAVVIIFQSRLVNFIVLGAVWGSIVLSISKNIARNWLFVEQVFLFWQSHHNSICFFMFAIIQETFCFYYQNIWLTNLSYPLHKIHLRNTHTLHGLPERKREEAAKKKRNTKYFLKEPKSCNQQTNIV
jgi:hypothetical protein